jgi:flagellar biosynthesis protein FlhG
MPDQADALRAAALRAGPDVPLLPGIAITGGKGGVGKTCIAVNLALLLARHGSKPVLVDLDLGLANADVMLGVEPRATLADVLSGTHTVEGVVAPTSFGFGFVPAASGVESLTRLTQQDLHRLFLGIGRLAEHHRPIILDTPAGIGREVLAACRAARVVVVVLTPEPTALADAYAVIKLLEQQKPGKDIRIVVNQARSQQDAVAVFTRLRLTAQKHLGRDVELLGFLPRDDAVSDAVRRRRPLCTGPETPAVTALKGLAARLHGIDWTA